MFTSENPDVRFDDVMTVTITEPDQWVWIDPRFVEVCEPHTLSVCGCVPEMPVPIGAAVDGDRVRVRIGSHRLFENTQVCLRFTGIRKGFLGLRFAPRTRGQFIANEKHLRSIYPGAGR